MMVSRKHKLARAVSYQIRTLIPHSKMVVADFLMPVRRPSGIP